MRRSLIVIGYVWAFLSVGSPGAGYSMMLAPSTPTSDEAMERLVVQVLYQGLSQDRQTLLRNVLATTVVVNGVDCDRNSASQEIISRLDSAGRMLLRDYQRGQQAIWMDDLGLLPWRRQANGHHSEGGDPISRGASSSDTVTAQPDSYGRMPIPITSISITLDGRFSELLRQPRIIGIDVALSPLDTLRVRRQGRERLRSTNDPHRFRESSIDVEGQLDLPRTPDASGGFGGTAFVHRPIYPLNPGYTDRLTRAVTQSKIGSDLFHPDVGAGANAQSHAGGGPSFQDACYIIDAVWDRIIYGDINGNNSWLKAYGPDFADPTHEINGAWGIAANNGDGASPDVANVFVAQSWGVRGRISRLDYSFSSHTLTFGDTLTLDADNTVGLYDVAVNDGGTRNSTLDDWVWAVGGVNGSELLKFNAIGARGVQKRYGELYPEIPADAPLFQATHVACGRTYAGEHNDLIYVADKRSLMEGSSGNYRLVALREYPDDVVQEATFDLPAGWVVKGLTVDMVGSVYAIGYATGFEPEKAWIVKFLPDLEVLKTHFFEPDGGQGVFLPQDISNPLTPPISPTGDTINGYGDLFITEQWSDTTGGQWFLIGTEITSYAVASISGFPDWLQVTYTTTDRMLEQLAVWRRLSPTHGWELLDVYDTITVPPGQVNALIQLPDPDFGTSCEYLVGMYYESQYKNWLGVPVNNGETYLTVQHCSCSCSGNGDCDNDGIINVNDVLWIIDYVIAGGLPPTKLPYCPQNGDWNCDGQVNIQDAVATADWSYRRGPAACNQCACAQYPVVCPAWPSAP